MQSTDDSEQLQAINQQRVALGLAPFAFTAADMPVRMTRKGPVFLRADDAGERAPRRPWFSPAERRLARSLLTKALAVTAALWLLALTGPAALHLDCNQRDIFVDLTMLCDAEGASSDRPVPTGEGGYWTTTQRWRVAEFR